MRKYLFVFNSIVWMWVSSNSISAQVYRSQIGIPLQLGQIANATTIAKDPNGDFYVGDTDSGTITKFNSNGAGILQWGTKGTGDSQFGGTYYDIAVDATGNVFVLDNANDRIQKFSSTGTFLTKWGSTGAADGQFGDPISLAIDGSNNVYVTDVETARIQKFDNDGVFITKWGSSGSGDGQFSAVEGIAIDAAGNVFAVDAANARVQKFSSTGVFIAKWGSSGSGDGQFSFPWAVEVDAFGNIFVSDISRIQKFTAAGTFVTKWGSAGAGDGQFNWIFDIETDVAGNVFVPGFDRIQKFSNAGEFIAKWFNKPSLNGQFLGPSDAAIDSNGNIYVSDWGNNRIQKFSSEGIFLTKWGASGIGDGEFAGPAGIAIDASDNLYVVDGGNHRIQKFTSDGTFISKMGSDGTGNGQFSSSGEIAIDLNGNLFVADIYNHRIQKFSSSGIFLTKWGSQGTGDGQFDFPSGIAVDKTGNVYVADSNNHRIQKFSNSGAYFSQWGGQGTGDGLFTALNSVVVDELDNIYASEGYGSNRIQKFDNTGNFKSKWGMSGSSDGQFSNPAQMVFDAEGNMYVIDRGNERLQKFQFTNMITSFTPASGQVGSSVTITGNNFSPAATNNIVYFGSTKAAVTSASLTQLDVLVPTGGTYQPISVTVNGLTSYSNKPFAVTFPSNQVINSNSFAPKFDFASGTFPQDISVGDFDGDGKSDLVQTNNAGISVFRNTSQSGSLTTGSFASSIDIATGSSPWSVAVGDLDGDGKLDIAVTNLYSNTISLLRNISVQGTITLATKVDLPSSTLGPFSVAIGDLDSDGKSDLAVSNDGGDALSVFRNKGTSGSITTSSFESPVDFTCSQDVRGIALGDVDGDGKPELVSTGGNSVSIFKNNSAPGFLTTGSFGPEVVFAAGTVAYNVAIGDLDGDGNPDLVVANHNSNSMSILRNSGIIGSITSTSFEARVDYTAANGCRKISIGDLTGDGKPELVAANEYFNFFSVFTNKSAPGPFTSNSFSKFDFVSQSPAVAIADLDGDGRSDLAAANSGSNNVSVFRNTMEPGAQATDLKFSSVTTTSFTGTFSKASGNPDGYLVLMSSGVVPNIDPVDGIAYTLNQVLGTTSGNNVYSVFSGGGNTFDVSSITPGANLNFKVFTYNGSGSNINYNIISPLQNSQSSLSNEPGAQPTNISFANVLSTNLSLDWIAASGSPAGYLVIRKTGSSSTDVPVDGISYTSGSSLGTSTIAYSSSALTFNDTGLLPSTQYFYDIFSYNGTGATINYLTTSPLEGGQTTLAPPPTISSFDPTSGQVATPVVITGTNFSTTASSNIVKFNGTLATVATSPAPTATSLTVTVPAGATLGKITVDVAGQLATSSTDFTVTNPVIVPSITDFNPKTGLVGATIVITGTNFSTTPANNIVKFGGIVATVAISPAPTATSITVTVPLGAASGKITVEVAGQLATSLTDFTVTPPVVLSITDFNPKSGLVGTLVIITGTNFSTTPANNIVKFNGAVATVAASPAPTATSLTVNVPSDASDGKITVEVGGQSTTSSATFDVVTDITPPEFGVNNTPPTVASGNALPITADFTDAESAVLEAIAQYRSINAPTSALTDASLTKGTGNTWTGSIPNTAIGELGVEYKFKIKNGVALENTSSLYKAKVSYESGINFTVNTSFGKNQKNYRIIAIPLEPAKSVNDVFSDEFEEYDENVWRMYHYENGLSKLNGSSMLEAGKGYWFISTKSPNGNLTSASGSSVSTLPFEITLTQGWNQIGNPYNFDIAWADVVSANPSLAAGLGTNKPKSYTGNIVSVDVIKKFEGAYVQYTGTTGDKLKIPVTKTVGRIKEMEPKNALGSDSWEVKFNLSTGEHEYKLGGVGMNTLAKEGVDAFDDFNVPRFFDYLEVKHPKRIYDMTFTKDIVPTGHEYVWNFTTETNQPGDMLTMEWDNSYFGNGVEQLWLMDVETGSVWDMRKESKAVVDYLSVRKWRVAFGDEAYVRKATLPDQSSLISAYPNPFNNEVSIEMAIVEDGPVKVEIFDLNGKQVRSLINQQMNSGRYATKWVENKNTQDEVASGLYIVRFQSGNVVQYKRIVKN